MLLRLLAAFILVPLIELYLLFQVANWTSPLATIALIVGTGMLGSVLARREGTMAWYRFQNALAEGRMPGREIQDGLMIVFAAALLLTPGLITDGIGFTLLVPWGRQLVRRFVIHPYVKHFHVAVVDPDGTRPHRHPFDEHRSEVFRGAYDSSVTIDAKVVERK
jgi:UPF0716 protein FxsA